MQIPQCAGTAGAAFGAHRACISARRCILIALVVYFIEKSCKVMETLSVLTHGGFNTLAVCCGCGCMLWLWLWVWLWLFLRLRLWRWLWMWLRAVAVCCGCGWGCGCACACACGSVLWLCAVAVAVDVQGYSQSRQPPHRLITSPDNLATSLTVSTP